MNDSTATFVMQQLERALRQTVTSYERFRNLEGQGLPAGGASGERRLKEAARPSRWRARISQDRTFIGFEVLTTRQVAMQERLLHGIDSQVSGRVVQAFHRDLHQPTRIQRRHKDAATERSDEEGHGRECVCVWVGGAQPGDFTIHP